MSFIGSHHAYRKSAHTHGKRFPKHSVAGFIDKSIYLIGILSVAANLPQLWTIWATKNTSGVSLISWTGFFLGSIFWFWYGILHNEKPIMLVNGLLIFVQAGIVLGLLLYT